MHYLAVLLSTCWRVICTRLHFMLFDGSIFSWVSYTHTHTHKHEKKGRRFQCLREYKDGACEKSNKHTHHHHTHKHTPTERRRTDHSIVSAGQKLFFYAAVARERAAAKEKYRCVLRLLFCTTNKCPLNVTHR